MEGSAEGAKKEDRVLEYETAYERYKAENKNHFLFVFEVQGLDGAKTGVLDLATTPQDSDDYKFNQDELGRRLKDEKLNAWWTKYEIPDPDKKIPASYNRPPVQMAEADKDP